MNADMTATGEILGIGPSAVPGGGLAVVSNPLLREHPSGTDGRIVSAVVPVPARGLAGSPKYLTTREAAAYLRKSVSWIIRRKDIPYAPGNPNTYARADLDEWFEKYKHKPMV